MFVAASKEGKAVVEPDEKEEEEVAEGTASRGTEGVLCATAVVSSSNPSRRVSFSSSC
jgi:hypothetical protein